MNVSKQQKAGLDIRLGNVRVSAFSGYLQVLAILLFSGLYVIRDLAGIYFPDILFSGICGIAFLILDYGAALGVYIFTTTLTVPHNEIMILYLLVYAVKQLSGGSLRFKPRMFLMTVALLVLQFVDMSLFSSSNWMTMLYDYITKMLYIVVPLLWYMVDTTPKDCKNALICYICGCLLGAFVVVVLTANQVGWEKLFTGNQFQRLGVTVNDNNSGMQSTYNANQLAGMMAISVSIALVLMEKKKIPKTIGFIISCYALGVVAMTKSRTGLLCMAGAIVLFIAYTIVCRKRLVRGMLYASAIVMLIGLLIYLEPELFSGTMSRFMEQEDLSNGRTDLLAIYIDEWSSNPWAFLFGYGIKSFQNVLSIHNVPHNALADILICWGLVGLIMVAGILSAFLVGAIRCLSRTDKILAFIPVSVAVVMSMAGQYLTTGYPHLRLCFLLLTMKAMDISEN